jgi:hypothetical protein
MWLPLYVCLYKFLHISIKIHFKHTYMYLHACMHIEIYKKTYIYKHTYKKVQIYIYINICNHKYLADEQRLFAS